MMRRILHAFTRPIKRLVRPLRLRLIDWQARQSRYELGRLYDLRDDIGKLEQIEKREQARLDERRNEIERGCA